MKPNNLESNFRQNILQPIRDELDHATAVLAEQIADAQPASVQLLQPKKVYKERVQHEIKHSIDSFEKTMHTGVIQLFRALTEVTTLHPNLITKEVRQDLVKLASFPKVAEEAIEKLKKGAEEDKSYQEILGMSKATVEAFYQAAKYLYEQQHYQEASAAFQVLTFINAKEPLFWIALGNSEYFCHHYEPALIAYALAGHIDLFNPTCHLYSCKCYEELGQIDNAINALDLALIAIAGDATQSVLVQKIDEEKNRLRQKINK